MTVRTEDDDKNSLNTTQAGETTSVNVESNTFNTFHIIIDEILSKNSLSSADYDVIEQIARHNPLAIETKLNRIFKKILLERKFLHDERNSYAKLMSTIIDTCIRLRRNQKIIPWVLMALNESLMNTKLIGEIAKRNIYILSDDFVDKFSASIGSLTNSQVGTILTSLIYHLDSCLMNSQEGKIKQTLAMPSEALVIFSKVIRQFTIAVLDGVDVFRVTRPLLGKQKFVNGLRNLGKTLSKFIKVLQRKSKDDEYQIIGLNLWKIIEVWLTIVAFINHYAPDAITENDWSDILHDIASMEDFNKFEGHGNTEKGLVFLNLKKNIQGIQYTWKLCTDRDAVGHSNEGVPALEQFWNVLVDKYPNTIHRLSNDSISELAKLLIENSNSISGILVIDSIQNNGNLVTALILEILRKIHEILEESTSTTKRLLDTITKGNWWENEERKKKLKSLKTLLTTPKWTVLNDKNVLSNMIKYLEVLLHLPLMYCTKDLKTIIFLAILSLKKETLDNATVVTLCDEILLITSERYNEDLLQYIQAEIVILELSKSQRIFSRAIESSLTNSRNYGPLKQALKSHMNNKDTPIMMVECIEKMKVQTPEDKELLKFEKKLVKKILLDINDVSLNPNQLKTLTVVFKAAVALKKVNDDLIDKIHTTLKTLTEKPNVESDINGIQFARESYNFIKVVLQYRNKGVSIDRTTMKNIWSLIMIKSLPDIVPILTEASDVITLNHALNLLRKNTLKSLKKNDENSFENCLIIWNAMAEADMGTNREKTRQCSLQGLMQSIKSTEVSMNNNMMLNIMKLFISIMSSKRMTITDKTIDLIVTIVNRFINDSPEALALSQRTLYLCCSCLKFRPEVAIDYLPIIMRLYLKAVKMTIEVAKKSSDQEQLLRLIILEIQKLASAFVKMKKHTAKLSPYIIADMIGIYYGGGVIPTYIKEPLDDSISQFLSICDQHAVSLVFRVLSPSMQEIFKNLYDNYIKFHKFSGKV
ncbi:uncharacterized protein LOC107045104 isoform X2 [Diachasma alloeum]|uniref:uncharacterized protein LOC107045104 isoform X2 n=1 Tax=Diachasma alloeum TaxID=454923 RepID=UPI00073821FA|nr:uncharacterized protein LOC107045104 isoform X2 [Diachasma alloeum]